MSTIESYRRAQDGFDAVLAAVPSDSWEAPSACPLWTIRDIAGHIVWGQEQVRHWATGQEYPIRTGAPGAPHPGEMIDADPVETWRSARDRAGATLTPESLGRMLDLPGLGQVPLAAMITIFTSDTLAHTWDIAHAIGYDLRLDADLVKESMAWSQTHIVRQPGFFGPELTPPADADEQTRWLAFLGRAPWEQVASGSS
jgi:uncharacterized protein (TIGR03086 family)